MPATSVNQTAVESSLPGVSQPLTDLSKVWILYYRHGFQVRCEKAFHHNGDLRSAVERTKKHCELMGYRWIFVRPFVVDLTQEEIDRVRALGS